MSISPATVLERIRRPEYTGSNRCYPCTVVNSLLAIGLASVIAVFFTPLAGLVVVLLAGASIYFRGYLVPGTPTVTRQYAPDFVLGAFGKEPTLASSNGDRPGMDLESVLLDAEVLTETESGTDLRLSPEFRSAWDDRMSVVESIETSRELAGAMVGVDPDEVEYRSTNEKFVVLADGTRVGTWPSKAAYVADLAGSDLLPEWIDSWASLSGSRQAGLTAGLRLFLEECPACGHELQMTGDVVESCCREVAVAALECPDCGARLFEIERPEPDGQ